MSNTGTANVQEKGDFARATILSRIMEKDTLKGYVMLDYATAHVYRVKMEELEKLRGAAIFTNAEFSPNMSVLNGTQGSFTTYPTINEAGVITGKKGIIVAFNILDENTDKPVGVVAYNALGTRYDMSYKELQNLMRTNYNCNFTLGTDSRGNIMAIPRNGGEFETIRMETNNTKMSYRSSAGETIDPDAGMVMEGLHSGKMPVFRVFSLDKVSRSEFNKSGAEKFSVAMMNMKRLSPYYFTVLSSLKRMATVGLGTCGVTEDTLLYDVEFLACLTIAELTYILIHEAHHIADQHSVRGDKKSSHHLWNVACDLYINTVINKDFDIRFGDPEKEIMIQGSNGTYPAYIKVPFFGCFLETVGETLDYTRDSAETIYDRLLKENPEQAQSGKKSRRGSGSGGDGEGSGSGGGGWRQQSDGEQQERKKGKKKEQEVTMDDIDKNQMGINSKSKKAHTEDLTSEQREKALGDLLDKLEKVNVTYKGKQLSGVIMSDISTSVDGDDDDSHAERVKKSREALQRMHTKVRMEEMESGTSLVKNAGEGGSLMQRYIEFGLSANVRWQDLVKNMCVDKPKQVFTLGDPNRDYMNMGMTVAARRKIGKPTQISAVKFAVDVSGSVSQDELAYYLSEINHIFAHFKVDGELIYWSTVIGDVGMFSSMKDLLKIKPVSDGGTDVKCVFQYLRGEIKVNGKREFHKPREIKGIFIITDGCFSMNFAEYEAAFGRKVVWLITGNPIMFNPPFGRVIGIGKEK